MHNQPTEKTAKYNTICPRPDCNVNIKKGSKIRVHNNKWYHVPCARKLERGRNKELEEKAQLVNVDSTETLFNDDYKYDYDIIVKTLTKQLSKQRKEYNIILATLMWYARHNNYKCSVEDDKPAIMYDRGSRAKKAINYLIDIK